MAYKAMQIGKELPYLTRQKILSVAKNYSNPLYDVKLQREYQKMPKVVQILQHLNGPSIVLPENVMSVSFVSLSVSRDGSNDSQNNSTADNILQRLAYHNQRVRVNRCVLDKSAITSNQQSLLEKYIDHDAWYVHFQSPEGDQSVSESCGPIFISKEVSNESIILAQLAKLCLQ